MVEQEGKYNIKAAALMLGIQPGTLRAWERRYQMISPVRNDAGHRLYTEEHIKILKGLIKKVNQGFTISQAISLIDNKDVQMDSVTVNLKQDNHFFHLTDTLYESLIHFEHERINEVINTMFSIFSMEKVILDIFSMVYKKIEDSFKDGKIVGAQRHFSISYLKARITTIILGFPTSAHLNKAVCITYSQEVDDIGFLLFSFYLRKRGIEVINIGTCRSKDEMEQILEMVQPDMVFISCEEQKELTKALTLVNLLTLNHRELTVGLGGQATTSMKPSDKEYYSSIIFGQTVKEWDMWLMKQSVF